MFQQRPWRTIIHGSIHIEEMILESDNHFLGAGVDNKYSFAMLI